jgi:hypothetical protein
MTTTELGWQQNEPTLTPSNVGATNKFGLLYQWNVLGSVYAQPLAVSGVPVQNCDSNNPNVVFVATEQDMLYAFCATSSSGQQIWNNSQPTNLAANVKPLNTYQFVDCSTPMNQKHFPVCSAPQGGGDGDGDNRPSPFTGFPLGVTGTPVIDPSTNTLYVVAAVQNGLDSLPDTAMFYYLFAVDITSGNVTFIPIGGSVNGHAPPAGTYCTSDYPTQGQVSFTPGAAIQRSALLLLNGSVYVAFAPYPEDYNGWLFGYTYSSSTGTFTVPIIFNSTPYGTGGGIWGSGAGPAASADGKSIYVTTGNGTTYLTETPLDMGDSLLRLDPSSFAILDYYIPGDLLTYPPPNGYGLCVNDADLGSGGVLLIPNFLYNGVSTNLVVNADKQSNLYVANQKSLGGYIAFSNGTAHCPGTPNNIECITTPTIPTNDSKQGYWASPAYWQYTSGSTTNYVLYYSVTTQNTGAAPKSLNGYSLSTSGPPIPSTYASTTTLFCPFSPTPSVSSNGNDSASGIVWAIENQTGRAVSNNNCANGPPPYMPAALHAFSATTLQEIYTSGNGEVTTPIGYAKAFPTPTIFQGQVYMGTSTGTNNILPGVDVFGLCGTPSRCMR